MVKSIVQRLSVLLATFLLIGVAACGEDFDPYQRLNSLRVLAIRSDPVAPAPGETSVLTPLVYAPANEAVSYKWSWCPLVGPANDGYPCLVDETVLAAVAAGQEVDIGTVPSLDLGQEPTASFFHGINPDVLAALCTGQVPGVPMRLDCEHGFPVQIRVEVSTPTDQVIAIRTFHLRTEAMTPPNLNPELGPLSAVVAGAKAPLDQAATVSLPRLRNTTLEATVDPDVSSQTYEEKDPDGNPTPARERLFLSWFVESGQTRYERTSFIAGESERRFLTENRWNPAARRDYPADTARLVVVLRDHRGGVSWGMASVRLEDPK